MLFQYTTNNNNMLSFIVSKLQFELMRNITTSSYIKSSVITLDVMLDFCGTYTNSKFSEFMIGVQDV